MGTEIQQAQLDESAINSNGFAFYSRHPNGVSTMTAFLSLVVQQRSCVNDQAKVVIADTLYNTTKIILSSRGPIIGYTGIAAKAICGLITPII